MTGGRERTVNRGPLAWLWFAGGMLSVGIGSVGIVVPGLPTTVFFIVAAACFARSSPRFEQWVLDLPRIGPLVRDHRAGLGMARRAKVAAVATILAVSLASAVFAIGSRPIGALVVGLGLVGAAYVAFRVPTRERVLAARSRSRSRSHSHSHLDRAFGTAEGQKRGSNGGRGGSREH